MDWPHIRVARQLSLKKKKRKKEEKKKGKEIKKEEKVELEQTCRCDGKSRINDDDDGDSSSRVHQLGERIYIFVCIEKISLY